MKRIFLSHRVDFLTTEEASAAPLFYNRLLSEFDIEIVSMATELRHEVGITDAEIVSKCLAAINSCDMLLFDCSLPKWTYIGCIFEVVYAYQLKKPIIVYAGQTQYSARPWLRYHATGIATTLDQVRELVAGLL